MSRLVLRKGRRFQRRRSSSFWDANVPPISEAVQSYFGRRNGWKWVACVPLALTILAVWGVAAYAQDELTAADVQTILDNIFVFIAAVLVIFMNAGFGMLETGFCRQKNAVNILSKNLIVFGLAVLAFWAIGFSFMFGGGQRLHRWRWLVLNWYARSLWLGRRCGPHH